MKRREFLSRVAVISAGAFLPLPLLANPSKKKSVIVAGAGIAGLYTADLLRAQGYSVTILEAADRLGGKVFGGEVNGNRFDFGAQAVSKEMLRVKKLAKRFGLTIIPKPSQSDFFMEKGKVYIGAELENLHKDFDTLEAKAKEMYPQIDDPKMRPILGAQSVMDWAKSGLRPEVVEYYRTSFASEWCNTPEEVSLLHYLELTRAYDGEGEEMDFRFREGLYKVVEGFERELKPFVRLNCPLQKVNVAGGVVKVTAGGQSFESDYLVMAIPVTTMKKIEITGVDASALQSSLSSFEGAAVKKVLIVYKNHFWAKKACQGAFATPCGMSIMDNSDMEKGVYSLAVFLGGPSANDGTGKDEVLAKLASLLGPDALKPAAYHEQAWLGSEHLCGGYGANRHPGRSGYAVVPKHVASRIFLAGSDVSDQYGSYVEGALASAERAAAGISAATRLVSLPTVRDMLT